MPTDNYVSAEVHLLLESNTREFNLRYDTEVPFGNYEGIGLSIKGQKLYVRDLVWKIESKCLVLYAREYYAEESALENALISFSNADWIFVSTVQK